MIKGQSRSVVENPSKKSSFLSHSMSQRHPRSRHSHQIQEVKEESTSNYEEMKMEIRPESREQPDNMV